MGAKDKQYDITLDGVGFMLSEEKGEPVVRVEYVPSEISEEVVRSRDVPTLYDDFGAGMGFSERLMPYTYAYGKNICTRFPRVVVPGPKLNEIDISAITNLDSIKGSAPISSNVILFVGGRHAISVTGTIASDAQDLGASFAATSAVSFRTSAGGAVNQRNVYVGGTGGPMWMRSAAGVWTQGVVNASPGAFPSLKVTDMVTVYQTVEGRGANRIVMVDAADPSRIYQVSEGVDPLDYNQYANAGIAGSGYAINRIIASNRHAYFLAANGVFDLTDQGYSPNLTEYWKQAASDLNGLDGVFYDGKIFALHRQGVDMIMTVSNGFRQDTGSTWAWPIAGIPNETPVNGIPQRITVEGGWLVVALYNETSKETNIIYGKQKKDLEIQHPGPVVWHGAEITIPNETVTYMTVSNQGGQQRLWIATKVTVANGSWSVGNIRLYYCTIPAGGNPVRDFYESGGHKFATSSELYLPGEDLNDLSAKKTIIRYDMVNDNLGTYSGTSKKIEVQVKAEASGTYVSQGIAQGSPRVVLVPTSSGQPYVRAYRFFTKLLFSGHADSPPILRAFKVRAGKTVELREVRTYRVIFGSGRTNSGAMDKREQKALIDWLKGLQRAGPVSFTDELGQDLTAQVESSLRYVVTNDQHTGWRQAVAEFVVSIITEQAETGQSADTAQTGNRYDETWEWADSSGAGTTAGKAITWQ